MFSPYIYLELVVFEEASTPEGTEALLKDWAAGLDLFGWNDDIKGHRDRSVFEVEGQPMPCTLHSGACLEGGEAVLEHVGQWMEEREQCYDGVAFAVVATLDPTQAHKDSDQVTMWGQDGAGRSFLQTGRPERNLSLGQRLKERLQRKKPYDGSAIVREMIPAVVALLARVRARVQAEQLNERLAMPVDETTPAPKKPRM